MVVSPRRKRSCNVESRGSCFFSLPIELYRLLPSELRTHMASMLPLRSINARIRPLTSAVRDGGRGELVGGLEVRSLPGKMLPRKLQKEVVCPACGCAALG